MLYCKVSPTTQSTVMYAHLLLTSSPIYTESVSVLHNDTWISMHSSAPPFSLLTVLQLYILPPSVHNIPFFQYLHVLEQQTVATCYSLFPVSSLHIHSTILLLQTIFFTYRLFNKRKTFNFNISHKISCYQTVNKKFVAQYIFQSNFMALQPNAGHGLLILDEVSRSHTTTHHSL
jgi:hypothetical protein